MYVSISLWGLHLLYSTHVTNTIWFDLGRSKFILVFPSLVLVWWSRAVFFPKSPVLWSVRPTQGFLAGIHVAQKGHGIPDVCS